MPELVEVEHYLHQFQPLVSTTCLLTIECPSVTPPKVFLSEADIDFLKTCCISNLERKGKIIRLHLKSKESNNANPAFLYFHMGMTGRISTPSHIPSLESISNNDSYPPPHTHLILRSNGNEISFSDPRRFGSVCLNDNGPLENQWNEFAVDAMDENASFSGFLGKKHGIKTLMLDQRAVISGVGNWIADEILYQCKIHPDQTFLIDEEVTFLKQKLNQVLTIGIQCLDERKDFPDHWMFQLRWSKGKQKNIKDPYGNAIVFVKSGGRTSAIVPAFQKFQRRSAIENDWAQIQKKNKVKNEPTVERDTKKPKLQNIKKETLRRSSRLSNETTRSAT